MMKFRDRQLETDNSLEFEVFEMEPQLIMWRKECWFFDFTLVFNKFTIFLAVISSQGPNGLNLSELSIFNRQKFCWFHLLRSFLQFHPLESFGISYRCSLRKMILDIYEYSFIQKCNRKLIDFGSRLWKNRY